MSKEFNGYYRFPTIYNDQIAYVAEDDIWMVSSSGGIARRLTTNVGEISDLTFSEDGKWIAFTGRDEGVPDIYIIPSTGGVPIRLTYLGANSKVLCWHNGKVIFSSNYTQPFKRITSLWEVNVEDKRKLKQLDFGIATEIAFGKEKGVVLGRKTGDLARWKKYRGGTAGELLIDIDGNYNFKKLLDLKSNFANPIWINDRIYFISDHEDVANIYSCTVEGKDLKKHTYHNDFYVRNPKSDGKNIVYHAGSDIYIYNLANNVSEKVNIKYYSTLPQRNRKFADPTEYFEGFSISKDAEKLITTHRGKSFYYNNWYGPVKQLGKENGVRYRLSTYLNLKDEEKAVTISDENNYEHIEVYDLETGELIKKIEQYDLGRVTDIVASPKDEEILLTNQRNELILIDLRNDKRTNIEKSSLGPINGFSFSPDGRWIAYSKFINSKQAAIMIFDKKKDEKHQVTEPVLLDVDPVFDPEGKYLYFLSYRIFNPIEDRFQMNLTFAKGTKPYLITLKKDILSPFQETVKNEGIEKESDKENEKEALVDIDFDNINQRILPFPVSEERYENIQAAKNKVFYTISQVNGVLEDEEDMLSEKHEKLTLKYFDFIEKEEKTFLEDISEFQISEDKEKVMVQTGDELRVLDISNPPSSEQEKECKNKYTRKYGWIDFQRINVEVQPLLEWKQMFCEAWRLQNFYFWSKEKLDEIKWNEIFENYYPLVDRITTRTEFSDLIWEMQGELKSSHAYEMGGEYKPKPVYKIGYLGADLTLDEDKNLYKISHIVNGDIWDEKNKPPLLGAGVEVTEGDYLLSINGIEIREKLPNELLVNYSGKDVEIVVSSSDNIEHKRKYIVKALKDETSLRYREWVEKNKKYVHEKTNSRIGYIHIPDMGYTGYAEFHRNFLSEVRYEGLIVDVRVNSGGFVSSMILDKLNRKFIGYDLSPFREAEAYQYDSVRGPMVAITNEFAGSDGDIFSHSFKLLKLGKLIGKRTWGGVIGIWPRNPLIDQTITTQPEMAFWFKDVGWDVENYGTDPDIEVDIKPKDYKEKRDPQLDMAIEIVLNQLKENPPIKAKDIKKP